MTDRENENTQKTSEQVKDQSPAVDSVQEDQLPMRFEANIPELPVLTALAIDEISDQAWEMSNAGQSEQLIQQCVNNRLAALGVDPSLIEGGRVPVRFVGVDGKDDIRVINVAWSNFGDNVHGAEIIQSAANNEEATRLARLEALKEELADTARGLNTKIDINTGLSHDVHGDLQNMITGLIRPARYGESINMSLVGPLEERVGRAIEILRASSARDQDSRRSASDFQVIVEDTGTEVAQHTAIENLERSDVVNAVRNYGMVAEELLRAMSGVVMHDEQLMNLLGDLRLRIDDLRHSRFGHESHASSIGSIAGAIEQAFEDRMRTMSHVGSSLADADRLSRQ